jgi:hypothetical protein
MHLLLLKRIKVVACAKYKNHQKLRKGKDTPAPFLTVPPIKKNQTRTQGFVKSIYYFAIPVSMGQK